MPSQYDTLTREAFCMERAIEQHGVPHQDLTDKQRKAIARLIARLDMIKPGQFDMSSWMALPIGGGEIHHITFTSSVPVEPECKTAACLAGWTIVEMKQFGSVRELDGEIREEASEFLDLSYDDAEELFLPGNISARTHEEAKQVIVRFWKTGEIVWED